MGAWREAENIHGKSVVRGMKKLPKTPNRNKNIIISHEARNKSEEGEKAFAELLDSGHLLSPVLIAPKTNFKKCT